MMQVQHCPIEGLQSCPASSKRALRGWRCWAGGSDGVIFAVVGGSSWSGFLEGAMAGVGQDGSGKMNVTIRRLEKSEHEYIAYVKSLCGKATYFLYFTDGLFGAVVLCNFVEMLKSFFKAERLELTVHENAVSLKHEEILALLKEEGHEGG